jgi:hypothetical protein
MTNKSKTETTISPAISPVTLKQAFIAACSVDGADIVALTAQYQLENAAYVVAEKTATTRADFLAACNVDGADIVALTAQFYPSTKTVSLFGSKQKREGKLSHGNQLRFDAICRYMTDNGLTEISLDVVSGMCNGLAHSQIEKNFVKEVPVMKLSNSKLALI